MLCSLDVFIADRTVKVWDLNTGEETLSCAGHKRDVVAVRYCRKSQRIFGASQNIIKVFIVIVFLKKKKDKMFCRFFFGKFGGGKSQAISGCFCKTVVFEERQQDNEFLGPFLFFRKKWAISDIVGVVDIFFLDLFVF